MGNCQMFDSAVYMAVAANKLLRDQRKQGWTRYLDKLLPTMSGSSESSGTTTKGSNCGCACTLQEGLGRLASETMSVCIYDWESNCSYWWNYEYDYRLVND